MKKMYTAQEMREMALIEESYRWDVVAKMLRQAADMMEREATREKSSQFGNAAKMREALEQIRELLSIGGKPDTSMCIRYEASHQIAEAALSAPPRNCDVCNTVDDAVALAIHLGVVDCGFGAREMAEFLLAEAKGESK